MKIWDVSIKHRKDDPGSEVRNIFTKEMMQPGNTVLLGSWPQGAKGEKFPIEWLTLKVEDRRALLLSRYILEVRPYHDTPGSQYWGTSSLRAWLNDLFLQDAFLEDEQSLISVPNKPTIDGEEILWNIEGFERDTSNIGDKIFLFSADDVTNFFTSDNWGCGLFFTDAKAELTPYVQNQYHTFESYESWWLRSSMPDMFPSILSSAGSIGIGNPIYRQGVRPALWLKLEM